MARTHYILIERPEHHPTAVSADVLADMRRRGEVITSERPVTKAEIKRERIHVYAADDYFRHVAWDDYRARFHGRTLQARVLWFNVLQGVGMVEAEGERWPIYACNIEGKKTWYPETACVFYTEGETVAVRLECAAGYPRVDVIGLTPGYVDNERWDVLQHQQLAFRCDADGKAITGLFAAAPAPLPDCPPPPAV